MELELTSPIEAEAEVLTYMLVSDDVFLQRFNFSDTPEWFNNMLEDIIRNSPTTMDSRSMQAYLMSLQQGYQQSITSLKDADSQTEAILTSLGNQLDDAVAGISELWYTKVDSNSATAIAETTVGAAFGDGGLSAAWFQNKISTYASAIQSNASNISVLAASLGDVSVRLETIDEVLVDVNGWSASASKLITAPDGSITGWQFSDGSNVNSEFNIYADTFKISDGTSAYTPFSIVDGVVYIGTINTEDPTSAAESKFVSYVFKRSASQPATPTGGTYTSPIPVGWYDAPPAGTDMLWASFATISNQNTSHVWSGPVPIDGKSFTVQYSTNNSTWHNPPFVTGDLYARTSTDNGATWSVGFRIVGENGLPGTTGSTGSRGGGNFSKATATAAWSDSVALSAITDLGLSRVVGDRVTLYNVASNWSDTRHWTGSSWSTAAFVVTGNMLVQGSVTADKLSAGSMNVTNSTGGTIGLGVNQHLVSIVKNAGSTNPGCSLYIDDASTGYYPFGINSYNMSECAILIGKGSGSYVLNVTTDANNYGYHGAFNMVNIVGSCRDAALRSWNRHGAVAATAHGIRGTCGDLNGAIISGGLVGCQNGKAFYAEVGGYGPFTGQHDALLDKNEQAEVGDIMSDSVLIRAKGVGDTIFLVTKSSGEKDKRVVGIMSSIKTLDTRFVPAAFQDDDWTISSISDAGDALEAKHIASPLLKSCAELYDYININSLGEGMINVCGLGGNIDAGDYICASTMPGKGMRQDDDLLHNYTVAKAREAVIFDYPEQVKMVACTYHCG